MAAIARPEASWGNAVIYLLGSFAAAALAWLLMGAMILATIANFLAFVLFVRAGIEAWRILNPPRPALGEPVEPTVTGELSAVQRRLVSTLGKAPPPRTVPELAAASNLGETEIREALGGLRRRRLVREQDGKFRLARGTRQRTW